ncbi:MAG: alpha/beta hydrolase [Thermoproteus sp. AZ2]|jgi:alpha-beta hydrolase superfamily lysophospholipase|uniref:Alpha/beta hydrolase n=1 Tax=Thermoproteus sp. AZ2 TaxID=1609232 RepID=A0ACC6V175_9CREN
MRYTEGRAKLAGGVEAYYRCWEAEEPKGLVVGVHGFAEHSGRYKGFGTFLAENGFTLCMQDLRGHGLTAAQRDLGYVESFDVFLKDLESFIAFALEKTGRGSAVLFGHSMGGLIALYYLGKIGRGVGAAITSGAAAVVEVSGAQRLMLSLLSAVAPRARLPLPINPSYLTHDERVVREYVEDPLVFKRPTARLLHELVKASRDVWNYLDRITVPILMIHGAEDKVVPPRATLEAYKRIKSSDKSVKVYDGMYHEVLNEVGKDAVYRDMLGWLLSRARGG